MLSAWLWSLIPTFALAVPTTTVYLHRTVTHRALVLHPLVEWWFKLANWISTGRSIPQCGQPSTGNITELHLTRRLAVEDSPEVLREARRGSIRLSG